MAMYFVSTHCTSSLHVVTLRLLVTSHVPQRSQRSQQPEHAQNAKDLGTAGADGGDEDVQQRDEHEEAVHDVPAAAQVRASTNHQTARQYLHRHLQRKDHREGVVADRQVEALL